MQLTVEALLTKNLKGKVSLFQTEKGYELACLLNDELAIEKIYAITRREKKTPFTVLVGTIEDAYALVKHPKRVKPYAQHYWPGAVTLITMKRDIVKDVVSRGKNTVGVRLTDDHKAKRITKHFGPLVVSNPARAYGEQITNFDDALQYENVVDYIVKGDIQGSQTTFVFDVDNNKVVSNET